METVKNKALKEIDGVKFPVFFSTECARSALNYKAKPGDVFIATYPKCGTTWMQGIVLAILRKAKPFEKPRDFFLASPFLDMLGGEDSERLMIRPGALKTHLSFEKVPWSDEAKYIYVARNPKDCCVSFYHHMRQLPPYQFSNSTFDEFFEFFINGDVDFGDYFDNLLSWYEQRNRPNVMFVTFEEMKKNTRDSVLKVAKFLGEEYISSIEQDPTLLDKIISSTTVGGMKNALNEAMASVYSKENQEALLADPNIPVGRKHILKYIASLPEEENETNIEFVRKGDVGDWRNYFTDEQKIRLEKQIEDKTRGTDVMQLWKHL